MTGQLIQHIDIIGFPMDLGADRRGVDMGPSALRIAGMESKLTSLGYTVEDHGDIFIRNPEVQKIENPQLKFLKEIVKRSEMLAGKVEKVLTEGHFPLCLGGDHSMALGSISGVVNFCRQRDQEVGVIWIDAHTDMNTHETTPSGNIHGMPLAALLGLGCEELTHFLGFSPKLKPTNCALIGIRDVDEREKTNIKQMKLPIYTISDVDRSSIHRIINKVIKDLKKRVDHIHVSFDLDSVDPTEAPGVGTPVPGGLSYREAHLLMEALADTDCMSSMEVAEVNPILDDKNRSAKLAVDLVASAFGKRIL